jgi:hypothetical protein
LHIGLEDFHDEALGFICQIHLEDLLFSTTWRLTTLTVLHLLLQILIWSCVLVLDYAFAELGHLWDTLSDLDLEDQSKQDLQRPRV